MNTPITADFITETADRYYAIQDYLAENKIVALWDQTHLDLAKEFGTHLGTNFWDSPISNDRIDYDLRLDGDTLYFSGTDPERDFHSFEIPANFVDPDTRPQAIETLRAKYAAKVESNRAAAEKAKADRQAHAEAEFERLGRQLGHLPG